MLEMLDKTLILRRPVMAQDSIGGKAVTSSTALLSAIPCSVAPMSVREIQRYQQDDQIVDTNVFTKRNIAAHKDDLVVVGSRTFVVVGTLPFENAKVGPAVYVTVCRQNNQ